MRRKWPLARLVLLAKLIKPLTFAAKMYPIKLEAAGLLADRRIHGDMIMAVWLNGSSVSRPTVS